MTDDTRKNAKWKITVGAALSALFLCLSFRRGSGGHSDDRRRIHLAFRSARALHRRDRCIQRLQGRLYRQARAQMRLRRRRQQRATRVRLAHRKPVHARHGAVDGRKGFWMVGMTGYMARQYRPTAS